MLKRRFLAASLLLSGCAMARPGIGNASLILKPQVVAGRISQATVSPYTQASIHHLDLKLFTVNNGEQDTGISKTLQNSDLTKAVAFSSLKAQTTYRIKAYAYDASSQLISTTGADSYVDVVVTDGDRPALSTLPVKLIDRPFNAQGTSSIAIYPGGYVPSGSESLAAMRVLKTLAGNGTAGFADGVGTYAQFSVPYGIVVDSQGYVYIADSSNARIRRLTPGGGVTTIAGGVSGFADGTGTAAKFANPMGLAMDTQGNLYTMDSINAAIRKITPAGVVTTIAGNGSGDADGTGTMARFNSPRGITIDSAGTIYVADEGNNKIKKVSPAGVVTTIAGSGATGSVDAQGTLAQFNIPRDIKVDANGNLYVADALSQRIRKITPGGLVSTVAGSVGGYQDGPATSARFLTPQGIALDGQGNIYVADSNNCVVRKIDTNGMVTTIAGIGTSGNTDGPALSASLSDLRMLTLDGYGDIYITDRSNHTIRKLY